MKIAILSQSAPPYSMGGVNSAHFALYLLLQKLGHHAYIITYADAHAKAKNCFEKETIIRFRCNRLFTFIVRNVLKILFYFISKGISYQVADIVLSQINFLKVQRTIDDLKPDVLIVPDHGVPHLWLKIPQGCYVVEIEHHNPARFTSSLIFQRKISKLDVQWAVCLQQRALAKVNGVVCPSKYMQEFFTNTYNFSGETQFIPNYFSAETPYENIQKSISAVFNFPNDAFIVYIPSGGSSVKGERYILSLIQMMLSMCPQLYFFVSGGITPCLQEELAVEGVVDRVFAPGFLPYYENIGLASLCSICVSPCLLESFGMALIEALSLGMPVFSFNVGGNRDIVTDECGKLVPFLDIMSLSHAACQCVQDTAKYASMSQKAFERAAEIQNISECGFKGLFESKHAEK